MEQERSRAIRASTPRDSSHREFGIVMAGACAVFALVSAWKRHGLPAPAWPALAALFAAFAWLLPNALAPLNAVWSALGRVLHRVVSPVVLGVLYFGVLTPFAIVFRLTRPDALRLRWDRSAESYWIPRAADDQPGKGMAKQF
jgi:hypothetical protein